MNTPRYRMSRPFADEELEEPGDSAAAGTSEPDYSFEGYSVDFIDKVALLPVTRAATPRKAGD